MTHSTDVSSLDSWMSLMQCNCHFLHCIFQDLHINIAVDSVILRIELFRARKDKPSKTLPLAPAFLVAALKRVWTGKERSLHDEKDAVSQLKSHKKVSTFLNSIILVDHTLWDSTI